METVHNRLRTSIRRFYNSVSTLKTETIVINYINLCSSSECTDNELRKYSEENLAGRKGKSRELDFALVII